MASYHCSVKVGGKGKASGHAAYIAREGQYARYEGYEDLEATGYGNLPSWAEHEPSYFWNAADRHERANGTTYRELEIALPRELDPEQRQDLVQDFIQQELGDRHAYQWAIHNPAAALAGGEQPHAHVMYSERTADGIGRDPEQHFKRYNGRYPELGGCRKDSAGTEERLLETRQRWADVQNAHLHQHGHAARVDHRRLAAQGIDREPEQHLGGRRVRQLEPEQREALLERREAEQELLQAEQTLSPLPMASTLQDLTAEAQQREQAQQAALREQAWEYARQAREAFQAEWERERPYEMEPASAHEPEPQWLEWIHALENEQVPMPEAEQREPEQPEQEEDAEPKRRHSQDWGLEM